MFGDRAVGKSQKYLVSQTFTASYPELDRNAHMASILLGVLVFSCKSVESYFFLTLSFQELIHVMVRTKVLNCKDWLFGNVLCLNQPVFTLTIMFIMDLILFFLDTFLWYIIWNTVFRIARSFTLGLSIWTPWKEVFVRLPKRIYSKLLTTVDMEVKYKPRVLISQIWNISVISMYHEHLLSITIRLLQMERVLIGLFMHWHSSSRKATVSSRVNFSCLVAKRNVVFPFRSP